MLRQLLLQTDDEYLIGLSNKGTVKRSYKDLEQETPTVAWKEDVAEVSLKDAVCQIRTPLGESSCSCPSRSVCRHLITAILWLKQEAGEEAEEEAEEEAGEDTGKETGSEDAAEKAAVEAVQAKEDLVRELLAVPLEKLKRACKSRKYREFTERIQAGEQIEIQEGTIVTVRLPWEDAAVKLLSPLEHSTCTCHSKELCLHKAQAILAFQLDKGALTLQMLLRQLEQETVFEGQELMEAAASIKETVKLQLMTGLSRLSPEAAESMERLAVICHGAGLADFEARCRVIASEYQLYRTRAAAFRTEELTGKLLELYHLALRLEQAKEPQEIVELAGSFRDTYRPVPRLHLTAVGGRSFRSKTGYEGEIYYFLETEQKRWYTWTDARPTFYEGMRRRPLGLAEQAAAPWGLNCSREQMQKLDFYLDHAKAAGDGRLSVSQETKSEIIGERDLSQEAFVQMIYWDYRKLLEDAFAGAGFDEQGSAGIGEKTGGRERLALVGAVRCEGSIFDPVEQRFAMKLLDRNGCSLSVSVRYSKEEKFTIRVLERLSTRIRKQGMKPLVFFGIPYLEQGKLHLYPIEFFEGLHCGEEKYIPKMPEREECTGENRSFTADGHQEIPELRVLASLEQFLGELMLILADLFQSGLSSVQEETLQNLCRFAQECEVLGLHRAKTELSCMEENLQLKRHQMEFEPEQVIRSWICLNRYLKMCQKKVTLDQARAGLTQEREGDDYEFK